MVNSVHVLSETLLTAYPLLELLFANTRRLTRVIVPLNPCTSKRIYVRTIGEPSTRKVIAEPEFVVGLLSFTYESALGANTNVLEAGGLVIVGTGVDIPVGVDDGSIVFVAVELGVDVFVGEGGVLVRIVIVGVNDGWIVGVLVMGDETVTVKVAVEVRVNVDEGPIVEVAVEVEVFVVVKIAVAVCVDVRVNVGDGPTVEVAVEVEVIVNVGVNVRVNVGDNVEVVGADVITSWAAAEPSREENSAPSVLSAIKAKV